jgi:hypothetical protein
MKSAAVRGKLSTVVKMEKSNPINQALATVSKLRDHTPVSIREMRRAARIVKAVLAQESERLLKTRGQLPSRNQ